MLSNLVTGPEKVVLFIDHNAYEPIANDLLGKLISSPAIYHVPKNIDIPLDQDDVSIDVDQELSPISGKSSVVLRAISRLEKIYTVPQIIQLIHDIKKHAKTRQLFVWCSISNIVDKKLIPFIAYMADIVVTLKSDKHLTVLAKRSSGSASSREYQFEIGTTLEISIKEKVKIKAKTNEAPVIDPDSLVPFKINIDEEELVARNAMTLPYEKKTKEEAKSSFIYYQPDSDDDYDDEDPDEDLDI